VCVALAGTVVTVPKEVMFSTPALGLRTTNSGYSMLLSWEKVHQSSFRFIRNRAVLLDPLYDCVVNYLDMK
jgi:hypothetical protein